MPSRNWCQGRDLAIWSDMMCGSVLFSYYTCKYVHTTVLPALLLVAVSPINVLADATDNCLLHVCRYVLQPIHNCSTWCSVRCRVRILHCCCCCCCCYCCGCCYIFILLRIVHTYDQVGIRPHIQVLLSAAVLTNASKVGPRRETARDSNESSAWRRYSKHLSWLFVLLLGQLCVIHHLK